MLKQYTVFSVRYVNTSTTTRPYRDTIYIYHGPGPSLLKFNHSLYEAREEPRGPTRKKPLNEPEIGVHGDIAVVRLLGGRGVHLDQGVHAVDRTALEDLLRR